MAFTDRLHNRGSISTGFDIENSLKFEPDNSEFIYRFPSQTGSDQKRMAFSIWLKRTELGTAQTFMLFGNGGSNSTRLDIGFDTSDRLQIRNVNSNWRLTTQVFRDTSAWYHLFFQFNTLDTTADDRIKVWVNGNLIAIADYTTVNDPGYDATLGFNRNYKNVLGGRQELDGTSNQHFAGYIAQVYGSGGTPPAVTDFGEFDEDTGIWKPIDISGISPPEPINGFFLDFTDASDLGNDASGNNNNWTLNNITSADQATDTPTNNFNIINPNQGYYLQGNTYYSYTDGNTKQENTLGNIRGAAQTMSVNKGKWYCEWKYTAGTDQQIFVGILAQDEDADNVKQNAYSAATTCTWYPKQQLTYYKNNGTLVTASATRNSGISAGDVIGMFLDMDNNHLYFQKNGSDINVGEVDASTLLFKESNLFDCNDQYVCFYANTYDTPNEITWNWGGINLTGETTSYSDANGYGAFKYEPVRGSDNYYALCTKNLAEYG